MKYFSILIIIIAVSSCFFPGCSKYEDGPSFSFKSKESRLQNKWAFLDVTDDSTGQTYTPVDYLGKDISDTLGFSTIINDVALEFKSDGVLGFTIYVNYNSTSIGYVIPGTWEFTGDTGLSIILNVQDLEGNLLQTISMNFTILRLASKELWLKEDNYKLRLVPKE